MRRLDSARGSQVGGRFGARPLRRRKRKPFDHGEPISRIDTRPMAFVFTFIAIVMLLPASVTPTHATVISLWDGSDASPFFSRRSDIAQMDHHRASNRVTITAGDMILWNGERITSGQLLTLLHESATIVPEPIIELEPDANASYDLTARTIQVLNTSGKLYRIEGLEKHCLFGTKWSPLALRSEGTMNIAFSIYIEPENDKTKEFRQAFPAPDHAACEKRIAIQ